jgi:NAD(P)-dependent dehydrogenase (short-subunit alcohol dehydrogenase family)
MDSEGEQGASSRRRVLVTGSSRGIGLELVRQYARDGYDVIATCRKPERATGLLKEASGEVDGGSSAGRGTVTVHQLDVSSEPDLEALATALDGTPIDVLLCNAAAFGGNRSHFPDLDWTAWRRALEVNVIGTIGIAVHLWRNVAASAEHKMIFVSSRAGLPREATPGRSYIYGSSKAALNSAARCLALDLAPEGVIAALVNPGHAQTGIGGRNAPMTPAESVGHMRTVIANITEADIGKFLHYDGTEIKL